MNSFMGQLRAEASTQEKGEKSSTAQTREVVGFLRRCSSCGRSMALDEGDVLFGDRWFHGVCWALEAEAKV